MDCRLLPVTNRFGSRLTIQISCNANMGWEIFHSFARVPRYRWHIWVKFCSNSVCVRHNPIFDARFLQKFGMLELTVEYFVARCIHCAAPVAIFRTLEKSLAHRTALGFPSVLHRTVAPPGFESTIPYHYKDVRGAHFTQKVRNTPHSAPTFSEAHRNASSWVRCGIFAVSKYAYSEFGHVRLKEVKQIN